jgi:Zn-dependent protease with chaperone function
MSAYISVLTALGWSLLASFWQMALLWAGCYLLTAGNKRFSAAGKHNLILLFIVFSGEWFMYTFFHVLKEPAKPAITELFPVSATVGQWLPYISGFYLLVLTTRFLQYIIQYHKRYDLKSATPVSPFIQSFTDRFTRILGITKRVCVFMSEKTETAETSGFLKPLILLPFSLLTHLSPAQVEAILVHELYHIRRNDYLINIMVSCFRSIFFFNPFAQLFYKALERERELACDDGVLELGYEPRIYAEALFSLEKYRQANPGFSLAVDGKKPWLLMDRIRRVLGKPARKERGFSPMLLYGFAAAFIFFGLQLMALPDHRRSDAVLDSFVPVHYELAEEKFIPPVSALTISATQKKQSVAQAIPNKTPKQKKGIEIKTLTIPEGKNAVVPEGAEESFYVDNNTVRNFSNESDAGLVTIPVQAFQGSPYVPAASLSYEDLPENNANDSMNQKLVEICLKDAETVTRLRSAILLKNLQREIDKSNKEVREIEMKNKRMILLDQKNIQPVLNKLYQNMKEKKKEIETMRLRLRISSAEIIHI